MVFVAASLSFVTSLLLAGLRPHPVALGLGIVVIGWVTTMLLAWGQRANPVSFAPVLSVIFAMAVPATTETPYHVAVWNGVGGWAVLTSHLMQRRYRTLALSDALEAGAQVLRARAALLESRQFNFTDNATTQAWIGGESLLAEQLQAARDFVYVAPAGDEYVRNSAILLRTFDLRDVLLASRLDLDLVGSDAAGQWLLQRIASSLRHIGAALETAATTLRAGSALAGPAPAGLDPHGLFAAAPLAADDTRARLLTAIEHRLRNLGADVLHIHALLRGKHEQPPLSRDELQRFVEPESWPVSELVQQISWSSPTFRHALRFSLALGAAYFISFALPWASHPHWLILSVAVVLRGNLEQTLSRRNMRIMGTLLGCVLVVALMRLQSVILPTAVFLIAVGIAHAFALRRYWLAASAATVMALLQAHLVNPTAGLPIAERMADTLLGALLAWGFSYVLPSWERRRLPHTLAQTLKGLRTYAGFALLSDGVPNAVEQRLARRHAYGALNELTTLLQRTAVEPTAVRVPERELATLLDHGQRLMAHLSMVRMTLARRADELDPEATELALQDALQAVQMRLDLEADAPPATQMEIDELALLPAETPARAIAPWLQRRLQLLTHEAGLVRAAAELASVSAKR
jgi:uncharacterized membrane protein YccC